MLCSAPEAHTFQPISLSLKTCSFRNGILAKRSDYVRWRHHILAPHSDIGMFCDDDDEDNVGTHGRCGKEEIKFNLALAMMIQRILDSRSICTDVRWAHMRQQQMEILKQQHQPNQKKKMVNGRLKTSKSHLNFMFVRSFEFFVSVSSSSDACHSPVLQRCVRAGGLNTRNVPAKKQQVKWTKHFHQRFSDTKLFNYCVLETIS